MFVARDDETQGALITKEGRAIALVGDEDLGVAEIGVEFAHAEDHLVAVFDGGEDIRREAFAAQIVADGNAGFSEDGLQGDALVGGLGPVLFADTDGFVRELGDVCGGECEGGRDVAGNGQGRRRLGYCRETEHGREQQTHVSHT
jgi:hypothetical protein